VTPRNSVPGLADLADSATDRPGRKGIIGVWVFALILTLPWYALCIDYNQLKSALVEKYGPQAEQPFNDWHAMIIAATALPAMQKINAVNDYFNQHIKFDSDLAVWQKNDYCATPMETLGKGQGDCEDFAIAKYFSLIATGIPENELRLMYVLADLDGSRQAHMVLAYYGSGGDPLVLDNINKHILPASERSDLTPVYSLTRYDAQEQNDELLSARERMQKAGQMLRRSIWLDLIRRARGEGFD
jgi:predicted transglutaminase-like cysteine proteinase